MEWMLLPFRRYAEFSGRSRRKEFWMFALLTVLIYAVGGSLMFAGGLASAWTETDPTFGPLFWVGVASLGGVRPCHFHPLDRPDRAPPA